MADKKLKGKIVLITGAATGIGFCTAEEFANAGCEIILTDINKVSLAAAADRLASRGAKVHTFVVDVSDRKAVEAMAAKVIEDFGGVDVLINNAGVGYSGELTETPIATWEKLVNINFWGPYHIYAFLPDMKEKRRGQIVNLSSGQAFFRLPTWGAYAAIKLAIGAVSEILHFEAKKYGIHVTTVYPFMVNTGFYKEVKGETFGAKMSMKLLPYYSMTPEKVGKIIFKAVRKRENVEMVSVLNKAAFYSRLLPHVSDIMSVVTNRVLAKHV